MLKSTLFIFIMFALSKASDRVATIYYNADKCPKGSETLYTVRDECSTHGRLDTNGTHVMFFNNNEQLNSECNNFSNITEVFQLNTCIDDTKGGSYIIKLFDEEKDSYLLTMPDSYIQIESLSSDCKKHNYIYFEKFNNCYKSDSGYTKKNITNFNVSKFKCTDPNCFHCEKDSNRAELLYSLDCTKDEFSFNKVIVNPMPKKDVKPENNSVKDVKPESNSANKKVLVYLPQIILLIIATVI